MTATIAKIFIILTLGFEVLTALTGSAYYMVFGYASAAIIAAVVTVYLIRALRLHTRLAHRRVFS